MNHIEISDHYPIQFSVSTQFVPVKKTVCIKSQPITDENIVIISEMIGNSNHLLQINNNISVCDMVTIYNTFLSKICNSVCPVVIKNVKERPQQVWYTSDLQLMKREKRKAERKYLKCRSDINKVHYKEKCVEYYSNINETRTAYYKKLLYDKRHDMKSMYGIVNKLSGDRKQCVFPTSSEETLIAEKFADFFIEKIAIIRHDIEQNRNSRVLIERENNFQKLLKFSPINADELENIFKCMKLKNYSYDPFPVKILSNAYEKVSPYILRIINMSIECSEFPSNLKHSTVIPLIKDVNGDVECMKNYRPLFNTQFLGKIIEKTILKQLEQHLTVNQLFSATQSGYRKYHSCETALLKIVNDIQLEMKENNLSLILMLDQSAAFDTVDLHILLHKLENNYGICNDALKWMRSYLVGRTFSVVVNGKQSTVREMKYGVPQGTIIAPSLYSLYTGDLSKLVEDQGLKIHSFADDTNIYLGFKPISEFSDSKMKLAQCINSVQSYMASNYLKLNVDKTQILVCGSSTNLELYCSRLNEFDCIIGDQCTGSQEGKTLGVKLDSELKFNAMISETCSAGHYKLNKLKAVLFGG